MSRVEKNNGEYEIAYGVDHIEGLFVQVFDLNSDEDDPIVDLSADYDKLTVQGIVDIGETYGFDLSDELEKEIDYGDD